MNFIFYVMCSYEGKGKNHRTAQLPTGEPNETIGEACINGSFKGWYYYDMLLLQGKGLFNENFWFTIAQ